jgi:sulfite exporter TauE/SafE
MYNQLYLLLICFGLGSLHGVIPDEHTWPITFSYSVGSATGKGGLKSGFYFALAFTVQRALMAEAVFLAFGKWLASSDFLNGPVYVAVGIAMSVAGYLILRGRIPDWHPLNKISDVDLAHHSDHTTKEHPQGEMHTVPVHWCLIHGFIAGFGVDSGLFSSFIYLIAVPALGVGTAWLAGASFGIGTLVVLMSIGVFFGGVLQIAKRFGTERLRFFGIKVGARSLFWGGILFIGAGFAYLAGIQNYIPTDFGNFIVLFFMIAIIVPVMIVTWREAKQLPPEWLSATSHDGTKLETQ